MSCPSNIRIVWYLLITLVVSPQACAHHSPSEVVEALTERIEASKPTAMLLVRRGDEYRAIAEPQLAVDDYQAALKLKPSSMPALHGLAHASFNQQHFDKAIKASQQGIAAAKNIDATGPFHAILARIYEQQEKWEQALTEWKHAIAVSQPDINWFLGEARLLSKLNRHHDAYLSLEAALERNPSVVLRRAWIKSLIDSGQANQASQHIEAGLARARWKSSWLLLRARLELSQNQPEAAKRDAELTLKEIEKRWNPAAANPFLTASRDQALAILGGEAGLLP